MSSAPRKRQRANTNEDVPPAKANINYKEIIETFDVETLRDFLLLAAATSDSVAKTILSRHEAILKAESSRIIDFDHLSKRVWHQLQQGQRSSGSRQYHLGIEASATVCEIVAEIRQQTPAHSSFGTKNSALETLRKIGKSLVLRNNDTFGSELVKSLWQDGNPQEKVMLDIVNEMSEDEKARMADNKEWIEKVEELIEIGAKHDMYESLDEMLEVLGWTEVEHDQVDETDMRKENRSQRRIQRIDLCRGCGCGDDRCSSYHFSEDES